MLIEFLEERIPRDFFEAWRWLGKIDAENSGIISREGAGDGSRPSTAPRPTCGWFRDPWSAVSRGLLRKLRPVGERSPPPADPSFHLPSPTLLVLPSRCSVVVFAMPEITRGNVPLWWEFHLQAGFMV
ncbi:MAG: hypothetical protein IPK78_19370 [Rhodospirillales bacterium]|nr:hypothetical protein [Rhodospirillales bacterium]